MGKSISGTDKDKIKITLEPKGQERQSPARQWVIDIRTYKLAHVSCPILNMMETCMIGSLSETLLPNEPLLLRELLRGLCELARIAAERGHEIA
jgi:hypothetical protein